MSANKTIYLNNHDLLRIEQIVLDHDKDDALLFIKEVIKKSVDRDDNSRMKRENT